MKGMTELNVELQKESNKMYISKLLLEYILSIVITIALLIPLLSAFALAAIGKIDLAVMAMALQCVIWFVLD